MQQAKNKSIKLLITYCSGTANVASGEGAEAHKEVKWITTDAEAFSLWRQSHIKWIGNFANIFGYGRRVREEALVVEKMLGIESE